MGEAGPQSRRVRDTSDRRCCAMFLILFIVLLLAWIFGWAVFHVAGAAMHLLLIVAVISLIVHFVRGPRATV